VEALKNDPEPHYGINTGFGILARERISPSDVEKLQENLTRVPQLGWWAKIVSEESSFWRRARSEGAGGARTM
jgi:histidine ammonia-lyase